MNKEVPSFICPQYSPEELQLDKPLKLGVMASGSGTNFQALAQAIALAGSKCVKSWKLWPIVAIAGLLLLVCFEITRQFNHPKELEIFTEDHLTHLYICNNKSLDRLKLAIDCNNQAKTDFDRWINLD